MANSNVILMDGAAGTRLWQIAEANGVPKDSVWRYNLEHPDFVRQMHREYLEAGAKLLQTNTFSANRLSLERESALKNTDVTIPKVVRAAVEILRRELEGTDAKAALSVGPLPEMLEPFGDLEAEEAEEVYTEIIEAGLESGVDMIVLETFFDLAMLKIAMHTAKKCTAAYTAKGGAEVPVLCSMTFSKRGMTMMGNSVQDMIDAAEEEKVDAVGLNCTLEPEEAQKVLEMFAQKTSLPLYYKPNVKQENAQKPMLSFGARSYADAMEPAFPLARYIGGCCGTDASFIREIGSRLAR